MNEPEKQPEKPKEIVLDAPETPEDEEKHGSHKENVVEEEVSEIARDLRISLPHVNLPITLKLIALFTLVGGFSIIGSSFVDIFTPGDIALSFYILRLIAGFAAIVIAYGIVKKERWAVWLYGILVLVAAFINFWVAVIPALIVVYLYNEREHFRPSFFDHLAARLLGKPFKIDE